MTKINCYLSFIRNRFTIKFFLLTLFTLLMICISSLSSFAQNANSTGSQNHIVNGRVLDAKSQPLAGATVAEKGGKRSVLTTNDGSFNISVPGDAVLVVSYVGYQTQEIAASSGKD